MDRDGAPDGRAGRHARRRMRAGKSAGRDESSHCRRRRGVCADRQRCNRRNADCGQRQLTGDRPMAESQLTGKTALVTGSTRGLGRAIALQLAADGATVIGTATTDEGAATIAGFLQEAGNEGTGMKLDVTDAAATERVLADIEAKHGAITILVNNAGITRDNLLLRMKDDEWDSIMATNLKPAYRLAEAGRGGVMK